MDGARRGGGAGIPIPIAPCHCGVEAKWFKAADMKKVLVDQRVLKALDEAIARAP